MSRYPLSKLNHCADGCAVPFILMLIAIAYIAYEMLSGK